MFIPRHSYQFLLKLVHIWQTQSKRKVGTFFIETRCIRNLNEQIDAKRHDECDYMERLTTSLVFICGTSTQWGLIPLNPSRFAVLYDHPLSSPAASMLTYDRSRLYSVLGRARGTLQYYASRYCVRRDTKYYEHATQWSYAVTRDAANICQWTFY